MRPKLLSVIIVPSTLLLLLLGVTALLSLAAPPEAARANETILYVDDETCPDAGSGTQGDPYCQIQAAVDAAAPDEEVRVAAGTYSDINVRGGITQVVYISKTVIIRGGYTPTDWNTSDPASNPTVIDAQGQGRGIAIDGSGSQWVTVDGFAITNGDAVGSGGAIYAERATITIANCDVYSNAASHHGGGVSVTDGDDSELSGNVVFENIANRGGGGINLSSSAGVILKDNVVFSNTVSRGGGGVHLSLSPGAILKGNVVHGNTATDSLYGNGGGLHLYSSDDATLTDNDISNNTARRHGGGLHLYGSNSATLTGNDVSNNTASHRGGGLHLYSSDNATLTGNDIFDNAADSHGGGFHLLYSAEAMLTGNYVSGNTVSSHGGGVYLRDSNDAVLKNNVVVENRVTDGGGDGAGCYLYNSMARFLHTTMARNKGNQGQGQGVYVCADTTLQMTNTILVDHTVGIEVASGAITTLDCTLWGRGDWANEDDWKSNGILVTDTLACNLWQEPGFADPDGGDYHIGPGSGAIDAGVEAGVTVDIDGDSRIDYAPPDLGADEFTTYEVHLPLVLRGR